MSTAYRTFLAPLGRLLIVVLFLLSGAAKVADPNGTIAYISTTGAPLPGLGLAIAVAVELVAGPLFLLGYKTRASAAILALYCVATATMFHRNFADQNQMIHFLKDITIAGGFLQVVALGGGSFTLDARLARNKQRA